MSERASTDERTGIAAVLPRCRAGGRAPPAAHPALAPSANIAAARRTEWPEACRKAPRSEAKSRSAGARRRCLAERFRHLPEITREIFRDFGI